MKEQFDVTKKAEKRELSTWVEKERVEVKRDNIYK